MTEPLLPWQADRPYNQLPLLPTDQRFPRGPFLVEIG
jgi:hypothetical protein